MPAGITEAMASWVSFSFFFFLLQWSLLKINLSWNDGPVQLQTPILIDIK